jgi:hypothetical protein
MGSSEQMPITTHRYQNYEYDVQLTPLQPSPYDPSRFEARIIRIVRVLASGDQERINELLFRIATGRDQEEVMARIEAEVRDRMGL